LIEVALAPVHPCTTSLQHLRVKGALPGTPMSLIGASMVELFFTREF
jgi:hypothetical protein